MNFVRKIANSNILSSVIDIPENLKNMKVEILIFPYENANTEESIDAKPKKAQGLLQKYQNKDLRQAESEAWPKAVAEKHDHS